MASTQTGRGRDRLAARRVRLRQQGVARLDNGTEMPWPVLLERVAASRQDLAAAELEGLVTARVAGASWEQISMALGGRPTGEALRKRYAGPVRVRSGDVR